LVCGNPAAAIPPRYALRVPSWNLLRRSRAGDLAMWIIMYIAVMASLRAMGLAPDLVQVRTDDDHRPPYGDI